jgi:beta-phosphoglucomutase
MLAEELKIPFSREFNEKLKGISRLDSLEQILIHGGKNCDFAASEKANLANKKNAHYCKLIQRLTPADILPGIQVLLLEIKEQGLKIGLASVSKNAFTVIDALKLKGQFDVIVDARRIKNSKPNPEIFLTAAELLQVEAAACIGIEDAAAGVEAIKGAGMFAIGIGSQENLAQADRVFKTTGELSMNVIVENYEQA